ncbi:aminoglycoside phosphotransferase family protein [Georgenia subflava]|uniref:Phosphotransferase n=1 Tax=Georgenia subflava TaxID=1622177 RepID=A0A6N7EKN9_9MICO|nr:aminoglycoside phosphotransferase family protein [Georgenia subflava]MPV36776.1 phosphotransferase [Georgenia subflava]
MHTGQVDVPVEVVAGLVAEQFPRWRRLSVRPVASDGTVNALFRLGDDVVLRFPLRPAPDLVDELRREQDHARRLAALLPVAVPEPLGLGAPGTGYPGPWTAYRWLPGAPADPRAVGADSHFARDLAAVVDTLHGIATDGRRWDGRSRGGPLATMDAAVRKALARSGHLVDAAHLRRVWESSLTAPHPTVESWLHADLMPGNLLVRDGRLAAVIDLETVCVGDPAVDLMPAWNLLRGAARQTFRQRLGADDAMWERGRGWALAQAVVALPYYEHTNPPMAQTARRTLEALLEPAPGQTRR